MRSLSRRQRKDGRKTITQRHKERRRIPRSRQGQRTKEEEAEP